jgi:hypothetical protein|tara:strand:- start:469 stop:984 length:516 start_codon:yes stop_codon:yes gene_type:complete
MKLLLAGDSFIAKTPGDYPGWSDLLDQDYNVDNVARPGIGEYKILKQLQNCTLDLYDTIIIGHTSPYRIHTAHHPLHKEGFHKHCDFIYEDVKGRLPDVEKFFTEYFDLEYAIVVHALIIKEINTLLENCSVINTHTLGLDKLFDTNRGSVQHLDQEGNKIFYNRIKDALR